MTMWHVEDEMLVRYAEGDLDEPRIFSIEAHLLSCEICRGALAQQASAERLEHMWGEVLEAVESPRPGPVERLLQALGVREHTARLLSATPSLRLSWFLAVAMALGFSVVAAHAKPNDAGQLLFLCVAPLLPVAGVAVAFGPGVDPTYEIGVASPLKNFNLLMTRAVAVLLSTTILAGMSALFLPSLDWTAAAWLLPALGLTATTLALATMTSPLRTAGVVTFLWLTGVVAGIAGPRGPIRPERLFAFRPVGQVAFLALAIVAAVVIALRREALERQGEG
jgi:hypothetical protein